MIKTGQEHLESLRDGRVVYIGAERVGDVTTHPAFRNAARTVASIYDVKAAPEHRDITTFVDEKGERHSTYFQVLVDSGVFAFATYVTLLFGTIIWLEVSRRRMARLATGDHVYPAALQAALVGFAVGCTFLSRVQFDLTYILLMATAAWRNIERDLLSNPAEESICVAAGAGVMN